MSNAAPRNMEEPARHAHAGPHESRWRSRSPLAASLGLVLLLAPETSLAREPARGAARAAAAARAGGQSPSSPALVLGWTLIVASLAAGAATTVYGLSISCAQDSPGCGRGSSLAIWGGVGIASLGSSIGLASIRVDDAPPARLAQLPAVPVLSLTGAFD